MRVVMTTDYFPPMGGGVEVVIAEVAPRLAEAGHDVMVIALSRPSERGSSSYRGVRVLTFGAIRLNRLTGLEYRLPLGARRGIRKAIAEFRPDVVNTHHAFFSTTPVGLSVARDLHIPSLLTLHIGSISALGGWKGLVARSYESLVVRRLIRRADAVSAVAQAVADTVSSGHVSVVHNGVDTERFHPAAEKRGPPRRVLFVGRLIENKGPRIMIAAFQEVSQRFPDATLTFVGDGPQRTALQRMAHASGVSDRVAFLGMSSDVDEHMRNCDIFVRPSYVEGMPLTVLEAMASGLPIIASDVAGVREAIVDGSSGLLVRPGSAREVADRILRVMTDIDLSGRLGINARERAVREFTWERTAASVETLLKQVAAAD